MANTATTEEVLPFDAPAAAAPVQGVAPKGKSKKVSAELTEAIAAAVSAGIQAGLAAARQAAPAPAPVQARTFPFQGAPARQAAPKGKKGKAPAKAQGRPPVDPNRPRSTDAAAFAKQQQDAAKAAGHDPLTVRTIYKQAYNEALAAQGLPKRYLDV